MSKISDTTAMKAIVSADNLAVGDFAAQDKIPVYDASVAAWKYFTPTDLATDAEVTAAVAALKTTSVQAVSAVVTLAEVNAGKTIVAAVEGKTITVLGFSAVCTGTFTSGTAILVEDTNDTPVVIQTIAAAAATNGAVLIHGSANVTAGVGMFRPLTASKGIQVVKSDATDFTVATSIRVNIQYLIA